MFKTTSFWSQTALNDIILICIKIKNKKPNDVVWCPTETKRHRFGIELFKKENPSSCRQRENKKNEEEEEEGEKGEGDLPAPRRRRVVFSGSSFARQSGLSSVGVCLLVVVF